MSNGFEGGGVGGGGAGERLQGRGSMKCGGGEKDGGVKIAEGIRKHEWRE